MLHHSGKLYILAADSPQIDIFDIESSSMGSAELSDSPGGSFSSSSALVHDGKIYILGHKFLIFTISTKVTTEEAGPFGGKKIFLNVFV